MNERELHKRRLEDLLNERLPETASNQPSCVIVRASVATEKEQW